MSEEHHRIESFRFCIGSPDEASPHEVQNTISHIFRHYIHPRLSSLFTLCADGQHLALDTIDIDIGTIDPDHLEQELPKRIFQALKEQLIAARRRRPPEPLTESSPQSLEVTAYLLQHGSTPWWAPQSTTLSLKNWLQRALLEAPEELLTFLSKNLHRPAIRTRLLNHTNASTRAKLAELADTPSDTPLHEHRAFIQLLKPTTPETFPPLYPHLETLHQVLRNPTASTSSIHFRDLLKKANTETSREETKDLILTVLRSTYTRRKLLEHFSSENLSQLLESLAPAHLPLVDALQRLIQYHHQNQPHLAGNATRHLWEYTLTRLIDTKSTTGYLHSTLQLLQHEMALSGPSFRASTHNFLQEHPQNLPPAVTEQIADLLVSSPSIAHNLTPAPSPSTPTEYVTALTEELYLLLERLTRSNTIIGTVSPAEIKNKLQHLIQEISTQKENSLKTTNAQILEHLYRLVVQEHQLSYTQFFSQLTPHIQETSTPILAETHQKISPPHEIAPALPLSIQLLQFLTTLSSSNNSIGTVSPEAFETITKRFLLRVSRSWQTEPDTNASLLDTLYRKAAQEHQLPYLDFFQTITPLIEKHADSLLLETHQQLLPKEATPSPTLTLEQHIHHIGAASELRDSVAIDTFINALDQHPPEQLRKLLRENEHLAVILDSSTDLQLRVLESLHPTQTSAHQKLVLHLWTLKQFTIPGIPWSGEHIYQTLVAILLSKEAEPPSATFETIASELFQDAATELSIPFHVWQSNVTPVIQKILPSTALLPETDDSSPSAAERLFETLTTVKPQQSVDQLSLLVSQTLQDTSHSQLLSLFRKHPNSVHTLSEKLSAEDLSQLLVHLSPYTTPSFPNLIGETQTLLTSQQLSPKHLHRWTFTYLLHEQNSPEPDTWLQEVIYHLADISKTSAQKIRTQLIQNTTSPILRKLLSTPPSPTKHPAATDLEKLQQLASLPLSMIEAPSYLQKLNQAVTAYPKLSKPLLLLTTDLKQISDHNVLSKPQLLTLISTLAQSLYQQLSDKRLPSLTIPKLLQQIHKASAQSSGATYSAWKDQVVRKLAAPSKNIPTKLTTLHQELLDHREIATPRDHSSTANPINEEFDIHPMAQLWADMLEKLWDSDPMTVIQQLADVALSGEHCIAYYQSITPNLFQKITKTVQPSLAPAISSLMKDVDILQSHNLLPGYSTTDDLSPLLISTLTLSLCSTHATSQTSSSITRALFHTLADQQELSLAHYLHQLLDHLQGAPSDWLQSSSLPSQIQFLSKQSSSPSYINLSPSTPEELSEKAPHLFQALQTLILQTIDTLPHQEQETISLQNSLLTHSLRFLPALWPHHASPSLILALTLRDQKIPPPPALSLETTESPKLAPHLAHIHQLFDLKSPLPNERNLNDALSTIVREIPHCLLVPLTQNIHQAPIRSRLKKLSAKSQEILLLTLTPEATPLLQALITRLRSTSLARSKQALWGQAMETLAQLHPHQLRPEKIVSSFLSQHSTSPLEQAQLLLKSQTVRRTSGHARIDAILFRIAYPTKPEERPSDNLIRDLSDTLIAISVHHHKSPNLEPLHTLARDSELQPSELITKLLTETASELQITITGLLKTSWPIFQDLSTDYQDPQTFPALHHATNSLLPNRKIPLPNLPGSPDITFETNHSQDWKPIQSPVPDISLTHPSEDKPMVSNIDREVWLIDNAGLVIFAPYFEMLFERAGLLSNKRFPDIDHRIKGIFLLHHLTTGQTEAEETKLLLNRILCNHPLDDPIPPSVLPGEDWTQLAAGLIAAVIQHWNSIGETTPEGLLNTFVKRKGSLVFDHEEGWSLHIPEGPYDILLTSLPWAISTINLPWMEHPLRVDWK